MPIHKKHSRLKKVILWAIAIAIIVLMIIYFEPTQNVTEIVLYP